MRDVGMEQLQMSKHVKAPRQKDLSAGPKRASGRQLTRAGGGEGGLILPDTSKHGGVLRRALKIRAQLGLTPPCGGAAGELWNHLVSHLVWNEK